MGKNRTGGHAMRIQKGQASLKELQEFERQKQGGRKRALNPQSFYSKKFWTCSSGKRHKEVVEVFPKKKIKKIIKLCLCKEGGKEKELLD